MIILLDGKVTTMLKNLDQTQIIKLKTTCGR